MILNKETYTLTVGATTVTPETGKIAGGTITYARSGNVVQVYFANVTFSANGNSQVIATGLPKAALQQGIVFSNEGISRNDSVWISGGSSTLSANVNNKDVAHWGGMTYITTG